MTFLSLQNSIADETIYFNSYQRYVETTYISFLIWVLNSVLEYPSGLNKMLITVQKTISAMFKLKQS